MSTNLRKPPSRRAFAFFEAVVKDTRIPPAIREKIVPEIYWILRSSLDKYYQADPSLREREYAVQSKVLPELVSRLKDSGDWPVIKRHEGLLSLAELAMDDRLLTATSGA